MKKEAILANKKNRNPLELDFVHLSALRASGYLTCSRVNFMQVGYLTHLNKIHSLRGK